MFPRGAWVREGGKLRRRNGGEGVKEKEKWWRMEREAGQALEGIKDGVCGGRGLEQDEGWMRRRNERRAVDKG